MKHIPRKTLTVTITNHGGTAIKKGAAYCYGIPAHEFPLCTPGAMFKVTLEYLGSDPEEKPDHFAFIPHSQFGRIIHSEDLPKHIAECRSKIRRETGEGKVWWRSRLQKLLIDQKNYRQSIKDYRAAVRFWKKNLPK